MPPTARFLLSHVVREINRKTDGQYATELTKINIQGIAEAIPTVTEPAAETDNEKTIWDYLYRKIGNAYGTAGLMGNLYAESALRANNLQNTYEKKLGMTDAQYTAAVDDGSYANFIKDSMSLPMTAHASIRSSLL